MKAIRLSKEEFHTYFLTYISKAGDLSLLEGFENGFVETLAFFKAIPEKQFDYAYAEGKWTIKELLQHLIDTERIFTYRALRFAREDKNSLPGYDENEFATSSLANRRSKASLLEEYTNVRKSTINLFKSFTNEMLLQIGEASGGNMSVRAIGFITIGHEKHHCQVITERYL